MDILKIKEIENTKLVNIFSAIGALPVALIAALHSPDATLFYILAIAAAFGGYTFWFLTDFNWIFAHYGWKPEHLKGIAHMQWATFGYAAGSIVLSLIGTSVAFSGYELIPIARTTGFIVAPALGVAILVHAGFFRRWISRYELGTGAGQKAA